MRVLFLALSCVLLAACAHTKTFDITQPSEVVTSVTGVASAGAVTMDITPPPGMPMGGYSVMANKGQGFRTRLKARVLYLNDGHGHAQALVQTDLTAASLLVHHLVAAKVAAHTGLKPADITMTASHSHSAPVNFFANDFYNKHTSSGQWLEEQFLQLVVEQISAGIIQAYEQRRPAHIATGKVALYGLNRNRSLASYLRNENISDLAADDPQAKFAAVNPDLMMLRVDVKDDDGQFKPLAAFSSFSLHNTTISVPVEVYNADVFAYPQRDLAWEMERRYQPSWQVVHAVTQATHADMAPATADRGDNWVSHYPLDWKASKQLGQRLSKATIELFQQLGSELTPELKLASAARELNIRTHNKIDEIEICKDAAVGTPVAGGAYERRTPWLTLFPLFHGGNFTARRHIFTGGCQGVKQHLGGAYLQPLLEPKDSFPNTVMFQILRINDMVILPLPFEVTVESGRRIVRAVQEVMDAAQEDIRYTWVASVANGYFGYTTTPEEYSNQAYEGGHTLYGKNNTPYLAAQLRHLAQDLTVKGSVQELAPQWHYELKSNQFYPTASAAQGQRELISAAQLIKAKKSYQEDYIRLRWLDVNPSLINLHQPLVQVQQRLNAQWQALYHNGEPINDEGYDLEVRQWQDAPEGMAKYETRWYNPVAGGEYRFVIAPRDGQAEFHSPAFKL